MTEYIPRDRDSIDAVVSLSDMLSPKVCIAILGPLEAFPPVLEAFFRCEMINLGLLSSEKNTSQIKFKVTGMRLQDLKTKTYPEQPDSDPSEVRTQPTPILL